MPIPLRADFNAQTVRVAASFCRLFTGTPAFRPTATHAAAIYYVRFTSTPAVAGQRSTAGFSLQVLWLRMLRRPRPLLNVVRCR